MLTYEVQISFHENEWEDALEKTFLDMEEAKAYGNSTMLKLLEAHHKDRANKRPHHYTVIESDSEQEEDIFSECLFDIYGQLMIRTFFVDGEAEDYYVPEYTRSKKEISEFEKEFFDKVWYIRHLVLKEKIKNGKEKCNPEVWKNALTAAQKIRKKYSKENVERYNDFEWGMLNGKLSALRWVLGEDWDFLDT